MSKANSDLVVQHVVDMEEGRNTARGSRKGGRSYARLYNIRQRLTQMFKMLQERGVDDIRHVTDKHITKYFSDMQRGTIKTLRGNTYKSAGDYAKVFKAFWHWWMKVNRKKGKVVSDVSEDISTSSETPRFVYLSKDDLEKIIPYLTEDEQVMLLFMFDSIIRAPTELLSLKVRDVMEKDGEVWVSIPDDISKTFGRTFNLLYCGEALLAYISRRNLQAEDSLFKFSPAFLNRKLKRIAQQVFGDKIPHHKSDPYKNLNLYDLRHSGAIHLRLLAKDNPSEVSLDSVRHRGGWADFKMLNYYTQYIGLDGKIEKQGMLLRQDKHRLERELEVIRSQQERSEAEKNLMKEELEMTKQGLSKLRKMMLRVSQTPRRRSGTVKQFNP